MSLIELFKQEMENESKTTRKMLQRVPDDKFDWKPHVKSMAMRDLAVHIADLPRWTTMALTTEELDFAKSPPRTPAINNNQDLMAYFESSLQDGLDHLAQARKEQLTQKWTLRNGEHVITVMTKGEVIRMSLSQVIHHRAQLGVYLRLLDIPIPGSYGPSADEQRF